MLIKTPKFWLEKNYISYALWPLSLVYLGCTKVVEFLQQPRKAGKPVICIGNLTMGGSGKTPVALAIGRILQELNIDFAYLSRGYGSASKFGFVTDKSWPREVGDEPLILAERAPTFVSKERVSGARTIINTSSAQAIVMDDGMQNNSLHKDFTILVIDGKIKFGNEFLFPAGPLRQTVVSGLAKANLVVVVGEVSEELVELLNFTDKKVVGAKLKAQNLANFSGKKLIAFCGLAYPQKFFSFLENQGLKASEVHEFPDHYLYKNSDLDKLLQQAKKQDATLITTKKDWVKFPKNFQKKIPYLDVELEFDDKKLVSHALKCLF